MATANTTTTTNSRMQSQGALDGVEPALSLFPSSSTMGQANNNDNKGTKKQIKTIKRKASSKKKNAHALTNPLGTNINPLPNIVEKEDSTLETYEGASSTATSQEDDNAGTGAGVIRSFLLDNHRQRQIDPDEQSSGFFTSSGGGNSRGCGEDAPQDPPTTDVDRMAALVPGLCLTTSHQQGNDAPTTEPPPADIMQELMGQAATSLSSNKQQQQQANKKTTLANTTTQNAKKKRKAKKSKKPVREEQLREPPKSLDFLSRLSLSSSDPKASNSRRIVKETEKLATVKAEELTLAAKASMMLQDTLRMVQQPESLPTSDTVAATAAAVTPAGKEKVHVTFQLPDDTHGIIDLTSFEEPTESLVVASEISTKVPTTVLLSSTVQGPTVKQVPENLLAGGILGGDTSMSTLTSATPESIELLKQNTENAKALLQDIVKESESILAAQLEAQLKAIELAEQTQEELAAAEQTTELARVASAEYFVQQALVNGDVLETIDMATEDKKGSIETKLSETENAFQYKFQSPELSLSASEQTSDEGETTDDDFGETTDDDAYEHTDDEEVQDEQTGQTDDKVEAGVDAKNVTSGKAIKKKAGAHDDPDMDFSVMATEFFGNFSDVVQSITDDFSGILNKDKTTVTTNKAQVTQAWEEEPQQNKAVEWDLMIDPEDDCDVETEMSSLTAAAPTSNDPSGKNSRLSPAQQAHFDKARLLIAEQQEREKVRSELVELQKMAELESKWYMCCFSS